MWSQPLALSRLQMHKWDYDSNSCHGLAFWASIDLIVRFSQVFLQEHFDASLGIAPIEMAVFLQEHISFSHFFSIT